MNQKEIIEKINVVSFDIKSVAGTISREAGETGDVTIFTAGGVRYIDPKHLRGFAAARQAANRLCRASGVRFLSGWAVPDKSLGELLDDLTKINQQVEDDKAFLIKNWPLFLGEWEDKNPEVQSYRTRFPSSSYVDVHVGAKLSVYRIHPQATGLGMADGIESEVTGLSARVLQEIAQDVSDTWNPRANQASQRIKNLLERIKHKCETLEFLGGGLGNLATFIEEALHRLPTQGAITGADFAVLAGILGILSSPKEMQKVAGMIDSGSTDNLLAIPEQPAVVGEPYVEMQQQAKSESEVFFNKQSPKEVLASTAAIHPVKLLSVSQEPQGDTLMQAQFEEVAPQGEFATAQPVSVLRQAQQMLASQVQSLEESPEKAEVVVEEVRIPVNNEAAWAW